VPWSPKRTPWDFGSQLLKPDLDRITPELQVAFKHYPAMGTIGIKRVVNGPFTFTPDGNPLVGPIRGLRNFWVACGVMAATFTPSMRFTPLTLPEASGQRSGTRRRRDRPAG